MDRPCEHCAAMAESAVDAARHYTAIGRIVAVDCQCGALWGTCGIARLGTRWYGPGPGTAMMDGTWWRWTAERGLFLYIPGETDET